MASKPTILIDLDSTIYDLLTPWVGWYNTKYNDNLKLQDIDRWSWNEIIKPECGTKVYSFLNKKGLFTSLSMFPGALEAIQQVNNWGIKQVFCTTNVGFTGAWEKQEAIKRDFPFLGKESLVLVGHDKTLVQGDILLDDGPHNIEAFKRSGRKTVLVNMQNVGYCKSDYKDLEMTSWAQYPEIVRSLVG